MLDKESTVRPEDGLMPRRNPVLRAFGLQNLSAAWQPALKRAVQAALLCLVAAVAGASVANPLPLFSQTRAQTEQALLATVQVVVPNDTLEEISLGSGTVIDGSGLILTNHHVVAGNAPNGYMNSDAIALIAMTPDDLRGEAVFRYYGTIVKVDPALDLALIQIDSLFDQPGQPLPDDLGLIVIERGDTDQLMIADIINIFGYPGIGGNTPTLTRGLVSGFLDEDRDGIYEWIKTDAVLSSGNSGGLATDDQGRFIGVPTAGRVGETAGQLGLIRSGELALAFVDSYFPVADDRPTVAQMEFATAVNRDNTARNPALRFASGTATLYAVFQHRNFIDGRPFTAIWRHDGNTVARDEFLWNGGRNGTNWVSISDDGGLDDGLLELEILHDNVSIYRSGIIIGASTPTAPTATGFNPFGAITFARNVVDGTPIESGSTFAELREIYAYFPYTGMTAGVNWRTRWYLDDNPILEQNQLWDGGGTGNYYVSLSHAQSLPVGRYRLELYIENELVQQGEFQISARITDATRQVVVMGTLVDRDNQRRQINGATVIALQPGIFAENWLGAGMPEQAVAARGISNRQGAFRLDSRLIAGERYSYVVLHEHYRTLALSGHLIPGDASDPYRLDMEMQRN